MGTERTTNLFLGDQPLPFTFIEFHLSRIWRDFGTAIQWEISAKPFLYVWNPIRSSLIVPLLRFAIIVCMIMTVMILLEKLFVGAISLVAQIFKLKPEKRYKWEPMKQDEEMGSFVYPMVLVQIPMYNEREVYKLSIGAACALEWPSDRLIIQVLDDSTDILLKDMVELECQIWRSKGVNIMREVRSNRKGYKAGALKEGMKHEYVEACEYIAIFDADFQPESDFLLRTIPFLIHNPEIALVQTRWKFVNADECLMTRLQQMSLDYHFKVEQEAGSSVFAFFGFNGTAGVWRIKTISDAGGWKDRTTVEDMDLAVRAGLKGWKFVYVGDVQAKTWFLHVAYTGFYEWSVFNCTNLDARMYMNLDAIGRSEFVRRIQCTQQMEDPSFCLSLCLNGWKFVYVGDIQVKSELPSTFKAFRFQQHRWSCGPANLFKKMALEIIQNEKVSFWKKLHLIYDFFFLGKFVAHTVTFIYYCVVIPVSVFFPEVNIPYWGVVYVPTIITLCKCVGTPSSFHLVVIWVLFENVMSLHRLKAAFTGLFEAERVNEWIVTEKLGDANKTKPVIIDINEADKLLLDSQLTEPCIPKLKKKKPRLWDRLYYSELAVGAFLLLCGYYDTVFSKKGYFLYLFVQGAAFFVIGFGYIGIPTPNS